LCKDYALTKCFSYLVVFEMSPAHLLMGLQVYMSDDNILQTCESI
jgi:hypothetical protein